MQNLSTNICYAKNNIHPQHTMEEMRFSSEFEIMRNAITRSSNSFFVKGYKTDEKQRQESLIHKEKAIFPFLGGPVNLHGLFESRPGSFRVKVNRNLNCVHKLWEACSLVSSILWSRVRVKRRWKMLFDKVHNRG